VGARVPASRPPGVERSYLALDHAFLIRAEVPRVADLLDGLLSPFRDPSPRGRRVPYVVTTGGSSPFVLRVGARRRYDASSVAEVVDLVLWDVYDRAFRESRRRLVLHAALAARRGRGVLMPGRPDAGKTTLVAGLVRAGFAYLSDEAAVFDASTGRFLAFPRPLGMEVATLDLFPGLERRLPSELRSTDRKTRHVPATAIRPRSVSESCRLGFVVVPEYLPGAPTTLTPMGRAEALVLLSGSAFDAERFASRGLRPMAGELARAECYRLRTGDLGGAVEAVTSLTA
jgi:hypothetical protein